MTCPHYRVAGATIGQTVLGAGYQHNIGDTFALFGEGGYYRIDVAGFNANGYSAAVGGRIFTGEYFEPYAKVVRNHASDVGSATNVVAGVVIKPWEKVGFIAEYRFGTANEADQWKAGLRYSF